MSPDRWDFISDHRAAFGVQRICRVLGVSRSGYYQQQATAQARAARQAEQAAAVAEIRQIHAEHHGAYGAPRIHAELRARGRKVNRKRVARLMRVNHIVAPSSASQEADHDRGQDGSARTGSGDARFHGHGVEPGGAATSPMSLSARRGCSWRRSSTSARAA
ncbi:transposase InsO family protein [Streptomyces ambofaciens]